MQKTPITPLYYDRIPASPVGPVLVVCSADGVAGVFHGARSQRALLSRAHETLGEGAVLQPDTGPTARARARLERYFAGVPVVFGLPLDPTSGTPFSRAVWRATAEVPYGVTSSYGAIARAIGSPRAARAVGSALGRNPIAILVPCHRILAADGRIGGWTGDLAIKRKLLAHEGISA